MENASYWRSRVRSAPPALSTPPRSSAPTTTTRVSRRRSKHLRRTRPTPTRARRSRRSAVLAASSVAPTASGGGRDHRHPPLHRPPRGRRDRPLPLRRARQLRRWPIPSFSRWTGRVSMVHVENCALSHLLRGTVCTRSRVPRQGLLRGRFRGNIVNCYRAMNGPVKACLPYWFLSPRCAHLDRDRPAAARAELWERPLPRRQAWAPPRRPRCRAACTVAASARAPNWAELRHAPKPPWREIAAAVRAAVERAPRWPWRRTGVGA